MEATGFPTSADIYLELDGRKIAVVQGYTARASKSSQSVEAFGESEPVATIEGQRKYTLELTRLYATEDAVTDGINFYDLRDFSLVICKPDRKVIYSSCQWSAIQEEGQLNAMVAEKVTVVASKRIVRAAGWRNWTSCGRPRPGGCWRSGGGPGSWQRSPWNAPCCATPRCWQTAACAMGSRCSPTARRSWSG